MLSDEGGRFAAMCGVRYEIPEEHIAFYKRQGIDIAASHAAGDWALPLPATYVVTGDGVVRYVFVDPDWAYRAEPDELIEQVRGLTGDSPMAESPR